MQCNSGKTLLGSINHANRRQKIFRKRQLILRSRSVASRAVRTASGKGFMCEVSYRSYPRRRTLATSLRSPSDHDIDYFRSILSPNCIIEDTDSLDAYNTDWTHHWKGSSRVVLQPHSVEEVAEILKYCHANWLPVVPQAGKTGLVGGSIPIDQEVILSTSRLNQIKGLSTELGILQCEAGCILQTAQDYCNERGFLVPIDLGAKGTCQIGGNLSSNAGGIYYYRYGSLAGNVLGVEAVTAMGDIVHLNYPQTQLKTNTGYKLHQLFIGAEGTLGIITAISLLCPTLPRSKQAAWLGCTSFDHVLRLLHAAKFELGEILAAFEWMDWSVVTAMNRPAPISADGNEIQHHVLIETHGSNNEHDSEKMERFLEKVMLEQVVADGVLAQDVDQMELFWMLRESCNPTVAAHGYTYKYDVSLSINDFGDFIDEMKNQLSGLEVLQTNWGHIMDGNLHFNVTTPNIFELDETVLNRLEPYLFEAVMKRGGSISAEHGLGQAKNRYLYQVHEPATLSMMRALKETFDPRGILNPNKLLPAI